MRRPLVVLVSFAAVLMLARVATAGSALDWLKRGYVPLAPAKASTPLARTPAAPPVSLTLAPRVEVAARLKQLGYQLSATVTEGSYELSHLKFRAEGTQSSAYLYLENFEYVTYVAPRPGSAGSFVVHVNSKHARAVEAVTCQFHYDTQANEAPLPATIPLEVHQGYTPTEDPKTFAAVVPTEKVGKMGYNVSFSHVMPGPGSVQFKFPTTPPVFVLLGCQVDVFPLQ